MTKFRPKFQFQILLRFYSTAEKVTKIIIFLLQKGFDKYHHLSTFTFWILFRFFMIEIQVY